MQGERSRYGLTVSVLGATLLIVSVFLPWYGVSVGAGASPGGLAALHAPGTMLARYLSSVVAAPAPGQTLGAVSASHVLSLLSVLLLVVAGLAMLDALLPLIGPRGAVADGAGRAVVPLGMLATALVAYRMISPPAPGAPLELSLHIGVWLALLGALTTAIGGLWPRTRFVLVPADGHDIFTSISLWTSLG
jgi:hypothetical protein